jgi:hypothetical protein
MSVARLLLSSQLSSAAEESVVVSQQGAAANTLATAGTIVCFCSMRITTENT